MFFNGQVTDNAVMEVEEAQPDDELQRWFGMGSSEPDDYLEEPKNNGWRRDDPNDYYKSSKKLFH